MFSNKVPRGLIQIFWENFFIKCYLIQFQENFTFRLLDDAQVQSEPGVMLKFISRECTIKRLLYQNTVIFNRSIQAFATTEIALFLWVVGQRPTAGQQYTGHSVTTSKFKNLRTLKGVDPGLIKDKSQLFWLRNLEGLYKCCQLCFSNVISVLD